MGTHFSQKTKIVLAISSYLVKKLIKNVCLFIIFLSISKNSFKVN